MINIKNIISKQKTQGIAERVDKNDNSKIYYLPHRTIIREDKTKANKKVVFDTFSSEANFPSFNDCLSPGLNVTSDILILLLQFRLNKITNTTHIKGSFWQIALTPVERNALRFLWLREIWALNPKF